MDTAQGGRPGSARWMFTFRDETRGCSASRSWRDNRVCSADVWTTQLPAYIRWCGGGLGGWGGGGGGSVNTLSRSGRCQTHSFPALPSQLIYSHTGLE